MTRAARVLLATSLALALAAPPVVAVTPLERSELRHVVTLEFLMESCTVIGETAYGMIPHFDCESFLYGVIDAHAAVEEARGAGRRACVPPRMAPRDLYSLIDGTAIPRERWGEPAASLLVALLERSYPCGGAPPLAVGEHDWVERYAEHPLMPGKPVVAIFDGKRLRIEDRRRPPEYPEIRVLAEGELVWHAASRRWVLADEPGDATAAEVGGCSDGPETVDLVLRQYQTC